MLSTSAHRSPAATGTCRGGAGPVTWPPGAHSPEPTRQGGRRPSWVPRSPSALWASCGASGPRRDADAHGEHLSSRCRKIPHWDDRLGKDAAGTRRRPSHWLKASDVEKSCESPSFPKPGTLRRGAWAGAEVVRFRAGGWALRARRPPERPRPRVRGRCCHAVASALSSRIRSRAGRSRQTEGNGGLRAPAPGELGRRNGFINVWAQQSLLDVPLGLFDGFRNISLSPVDLS